MILNQGKHKKNLTGQQIFKTCLYLNGEITNTKFEDSLEFKDVVKEYADIVE